VSRLRKGLVEAGVFRVKPREIVREVRTGRGTNTKTRKEIAPDPRDPLYFETASTLPVDFHSFRRAFNTGLAEAGVNVQHAMHLAAHSDAKVHARYVMSTEAMRTIPAAALPALPLGPLPVPRDDSPSKASESAPPDPSKSDAEAPRIVTGCDDSSPEPSDDGENINDSGAGEGIRTLDVHLGKTKMCRERSLQPVSRSNEFRRLALRGVA
jgi:hypothetical protein